MKKLLGILFVIFAMVLSYQLLQEISWESRPAIVDTIAETVQQTVQDTGVRLKEELDRIQSEQNLQAGLSMKNTSAEAIVSEEKLSTKDEEGIVNFLAALLDERSPSVTFHIYGSYDDVSNHLAGWLNDAFVINEYARYAMSSYSYTISSKLLYTEVELKTVFRESKEMTAQVIQYAQELLTSMNISQYAEEQQVKLIHDWIVTHVQYDESLTRYTAYEALTEGLAVCQGYAMLGYVLYSEAGFDVRIVEGTGKGQEHAWNMILLDDEWYQLDLTWDDPIGQAADEVSYRYYLVSDEELRKDHVWQGNYPVAAVSYKTTLNDRAASLEAGSSEYGELQVLRQELGFHWQDNHVTIESYHQLQQRLKQVVEQRAAEAEFRYLKGSSTKEDVDKALRSLKTGLSYELSYYEYSDQGDVIVKLTLGY